MRGGPGHRQRQREPPPYSGRPSKVWTPDNFTCTTLPCDGWIDNAGWEINGEGEPWPLTIKEFNATYVLPPVPPQRRSPPNCTFNYTSADTCPGIAFFTGVENSDGWDRLCRACVITLKLNAHAMNNQN